VHPHLYGRGQSGPEAWWDQASHQRLCLSPNLLHSVNQYIIGKYFKARDKDRRGLCLAQRAQAAGANLNLATLAVLNDGRPLDVHLELALDVPHRVADVKTELGGLATHFTLCHKETASWNPNNYSI